MGYGMFKKFTLNNKSHSTKKANCKVDTYWTINTAFKALMKYTKNVQKIKLCLTF